MSETNRRFYVNGRPCVTCKNKDCTNRVFVDKCRNLECSTCLNRKYYFRFPLKRYWHHLRESAERRGYRFALEPYAAFREWCYANSFRPQPNLPRSQRPSIDRKDEMGDYTFDNIQVLTVSANIIKSHKHRSAMAQAQRDFLSSEPQDCNDANPF